MEDSQNFSGIVAGRNAVREALKREEACEKIYVQRSNLHGSISEILALAKEKKIPVEQLDAEKLQALCPGVVHQGIAARVSPVELLDLDTLCERAFQKTDKPLFLIADRIADPHNFGALLRCCEGAGVQGVLFPKHDACPVTATVVKSSAGAALHVPLCRVTNLSRAIDALKARGVWVCAVESGGDDYAKFDYDLPLALILGSEETGVARLLKEHSDFCISIPMHGKVNSLNVSCAAAVVLYAADACRRNAKRNGLS